MSKNNGLSSELKDHLRSLTDGSIGKGQTALVGVASAERLAGAPTGHRPGDFLSGAGSVVVIGLPVLRAFANGYHKWLSNSEKVPETVKKSSVGPDEILSGPRTVDETFYPRHAIRNHIWRRCTYEFLNMELQRLSFYAACFLEEKGYESIYMPTTYGSTFSWKVGYPLPNYMAPFSHRHAAVAAGLGQFGLNNLVLTSRYGPLVRFVSVITAAELKPDPLLEEKLCLGTKCSLCRKNCPNGCFEESLDEYEFGGVHACHWQMDHAACGSYRDPSRVPCTRQCWTECPAGLQRHKDQKRSGI